MLAGVGVGLALMALPAMLLAVTALVEHQPSYGLTAGAMLAIAAAGGGMGALFYANDGIPGLVLAALCTAGSLALLIFQSWQPVPFICVVIAVAVSGLVLSVVSKALPLFIPPLLAVTGGFLSLATERDIWRARDAVPSTVAAEVSRANTYAHRDSSNYLAQVFLARALVHANQAAQAEAPARRAVALAPDQGISHAALGSVLLAEHQPASAVAELELSQRLGFFDPVVYNTLAYAYSMTNRDSDAARIYQEGLSRFGANPVLATGYAGFLGRTHRPGAMEAATRAVGVAPDYGPAYATLAMMYAQKGDVRRARAEMQRATTLMPNLWSYWGYLGAYAFLDGDTTAARDAFARARALDSAGVDRNAGWRQMWQAANARKR